MKVEIRTFFDINDIKEEIQSAFIAKYCDGELDDDDIVLTAEVSGGEPAKLYGEPENCHPGTPPAIEDIVAEIEINKKRVDVTEYFTEKFLENDVDFHEKAIELVADEVSSYEGD